MIIKRSLKSQMPSLKRCKLGDSAGEDDDNNNSASARKKRKLNGYYPFSLLGEVANGIIPLSFRGILAASGDSGRFSASWCTEVSCSPPGEVESESEPEPKSTGGGSTRPGNRTVEVSRPPLVRTSRGRVQVLPSRFNDSVIENWRKESKSSLPDYDSDEELQCHNNNTIRKDKEKVIFRAPKTLTSNVSMSKQRIEARIGYNKSRKSSTLYEIDEDRGAGYKKYLSSRSTLTSLHVQFAEDEKCEDVNLASLERRREDGLYGPEDFYSGDIVWAKSGKKDPFWPAIVIDPMTQAPELVLRSCIADAACVMFFGHSGNENQRDYAWVRRGMIFPFMDFVDRFQEQSELVDCKLNDFQLAIEEAFMAEQGFTEKLIHDINMAAGNPTYDETVYRWLHEATGSNQDQDCFLPNQVNW